MISYDKLREWLCNWVYKDCIPPSVIAKEGMEEFRMTENKRFVYVLSNFLLYEFEDIIMVSLNYDEIMSCFTRERMKLDNDWGLSIKKYELGKEYGHILLVETVREVVRKNGKLEEY